jgi:hypothetical protein
MAQGGRKYPSAHTLRRRAGRDRNADTREDQEIRSKERLYSLGPAGKTYDPVIYERAGRGFMRDGEAPDATEANRKARDEAWIRVGKISQNQLALAGRLRHGAGYFAEYLAYTGGNVWHDRACGYRDETSH